MKSSPWRCGRRGWAAWSLRLLSAGDGDCDVDMLSIVLCKGRVIVRVSSEVKVEVLLGFWRVLRWRYCLTFGGGCGRGIVRLSTKCEVDVLRDFWLGL